MGAILMRLIFKERINKMQIAGMVIMFFCPVLIGLANSNSTDIQANIT